MNKVAYLGIPGSFSYSAALKYFGTDASLSGYENFKGVFDALRENTVEFGIIPIENSLAGSIYDNYDYLSEYKANAIGELYLKVEHHLMIKNPLDTSEKALQEIKKVYSHPKALEQCNMFFEKYPHIEKIAYGDTASAAKYVSELQNPTIAAIANREAAEMYGLSIIKPNIQDHAINYTRFLVLSKNRSFADDSNKCSIMFTLSHVPGSLMNTLKILADQDYNLTKIESRPIQAKPFEYIFYVDFEFPKGDMQAIDNVFNELRKYTITLQVLGFYKSEKTL